MAAAGPALLLLFVALAPTCCALTESECREVLPADEVNLDGISAWGRAVSNDTVMRFYATGEYRGYAEIEEYVRTLDPFQSAFFDSRDYLHRDIVFRSADSHTCTFVAYEINKRYRVGPPESEWVVPKMNKIKIDGATGNIISWDIYIHPDGWAFLWLSRDVMQTAIQMCGLMQAYCPQTWGFNEFANISECIAAARTLPMSEEGVYVDGDSLGCRVLHAELAVYSNATHCPHLSLRPQQDLRGRLKCQGRSRRVPAGAGFDRADFDRYHAFIHRGGVAMPPGWSAGPAGGCAADADCFVGMRCAEGTCYADHRLTNVTVPYPPARATCGDLKRHYQAHGCCGNPMGAVPRYGMACGELKELYKAHQCCGNPAREVVVGTRA